MAKQTDAQRRTYFRPELDTHWIHPWIGLDWIGSICGRNCMDWTGLGQMTANCLESEIFRDSKLDWSNKLCILAFSVCVAFSDF